MSQQMPLELMSRTLQRKCGHEPGKAMEHSCEDEHPHGKQVMADWHANVEPAATVFDQKKEMQGCEVWKYNDEKKECSIRNLNWL